MSDTDQCDVMVRLKLRLSEIRETIESGLTDLQPMIGQFNSLVAEDIRSENNPELAASWIERVQTLSTSCNKEMVDFTSSVLQEAINICGSAPCEFASIGIGSIARGETTPYSDLEFLFLVENMTYEMYFERLAVTTYFLIGNLAETKLKYMNIEELCENRWFEDESKSGLKIDGLSPCAGNIPTGNGTEERRNKFIRTVDQLVTIYEEVYQNVPDSETALRGDMSAMLTSTVLLYGSERIVAEFQQRVSSVSSSFYRDLITVGMIVSDIHKYFLSPSIEIDISIDLKDEIYRFSTLLVFNLKIAYSVSSTECWSVIEELEASGVLLDIVAQSLRFLVATALYIRLSAYTHYGSQLNAISIWPAEEMGFIGGKWKKNWRISKQLLIMFLLHTLAVERGVLKQIQGKSVEKPVEIDERMVVGKALFYCRDYKSSLNLSATATATCQSNPMWELMNIHALVACSRFDEAFSMAEQMAEEDGFTAGLGNYVQLNMMGFIKISTGECREALRYFLSSLVALQQVKMRNGDGSDQGDEHGDRIKKEQVDRNSDYFHSHWYIGSMYRHLGKHSAALRNYEKCKDILTTYEGDNSLTTADLYHLMGLVYEYQGEYEKALEYHEKDLAIRRAIYGHVNHPDIATSYQFMGSVYGSQEQYEEALECYEKSLNILLTAFGDENNPLIAISYAKMGEVYHSQGKYDKALECHEKNLAILLTVYGDLNHPSIAGAYKHVGSVYQSQGDYRKAKECQEKCLAIQLAVPGNMDHLHIADTYCYMGDANFSLRNYRRAWNYWQTSLKIMSQQK